MGVLLMVMTIGGLFFAALLVGIGILGKQGWLIRFTAGAVAVWLIFYAATLVGFSLTSTERTLAVGQPKEYCGFYLDCHMHTEVTRVRKAKSIGDLTARGTFHIVSVRVFSNARSPTISFRLITPAAMVRDAAGNTYQRDPAAEALLASAAVELGQDIRGSQTIEKEIVFDLPTDALEPRLDIREGYGIDHVIEAVLIDDEDSILHKRQFFNLAEQNNTAGM